MKDGGTDPLFTLAAETVRGVLLLKQEEEEEVERGMIERVRPWKWDLNGVLLLLLLLIA